MLLTSDQIGIPSEDFSLITWPIWAGQTHAVKEAGELKLS